MDVEKSTSARRYRHRGETYYTQLQVGLQERFREYRQLSELRDPESVSALSDDEFLLLAPAQAILWILNQPGVTPHDLDACEEAFLTSPNNSSLDVLSSLKDRDFIVFTEDDAGTFWSLTERGKDYLASREAE